MDVEKTYDHIIEKLKEDKRPLLRLSNDEVQDLFNYWMAVLKEPEEVRHQNLMKILCILDHSQALSDPLLPLFVATLKTVEHSQIRIFTLSASIKHVIEHWFRQGNPLPELFIETIKELIETNKDPEVLEWLLRTVETCGGQSFKFKDVILRNRPGMLSLLNKHNRNSIELIDLMLKRWPNV
ncbi:MAG: hypothetical protein EP326_03485 [Deltaproteobacteria bacterium]|jgi:hypothetical protein|nr:MAG: hypothetical protein EP326_03485 [Deltaproteobacteria bacterium]TNF25465.1 MAG: hypothetical protein EP319_16125 [Deltaproteobacteria bacterium]